MATALGVLPQFHAFFGITFLSMKKSGVAVGNPIAWGSTQEQEILDAFFRPPGARPGKPFYVPFGRENDEAGHWKNPKYSGGTLQRARTTDNFKPAFHHPSPTLWAFLPDYVEVLLARLPKSDGKAVRLPVFDLVAWLFRERELPRDLLEVVRLFRQEFGLADDEEFERLFDADAAGENPELFFFDGPPDRSDLVELLGGVPDGPLLGTRTEEQLISGIEEFFREEALLSLPPGFVRSFYYSVKTQRFIVLAGRPGTGKTAFARAFAAALEAQFPESVSEIVLSIGQDFGDSDVVGYEKIAGGLAPTELTKRLFLDERPKNLYVVVLDEMNLAHVDYYFARLLPAIESDAPVELPGLNASTSLPADTYFIGTVNSYMDEPTRVPLSGPVKRRANIVVMPNVLDLLLAADDRKGFDHTVKALLKRSLKAYRQRGDAGFPSILDGFRIGDLEAATSKDSRVLTGGFLDVIWAICRICASDSRTSLTLGVLQDLVEYVALSGWTSPLTALDIQVAQKLVPQLSGPAEVAKKLAAYIEQLAGAEARFESALSALAQLLRSEDPSSGLVYFAY
jgi:energy-coupling factor transporter ATP-binding protein EcfA2